MTRRIEDAERLDCGCWIWRETESASYPQAGYGATWVTANVDQPQLTNGTCNRFQYSPTREQAVEHAQVWAGCPSRRQVARKRLETALGTGRARKAVQGEEIAPCG